MNTTSRPAIITALCPKFEKLKNTEDNRQKAIDATLKLLRQKGYKLFFWVLEHQWAKNDSVSQEEISELHLYGVVEVFRERNVESKVRAQLVRKFVSDVVLASD